MKITVHYNILDANKNIFNSSQKTFTKIFFSLDEAREWVETTTDPIFNIQIEIE